jgi:hypothetical protein
MAVVQIFVLSCSWYLVAALPLLLLLPLLFVLQLALEKDLNLKQIKFFVIDECDKVLEKNGEPCC